MAPNDGDHRSTRHATVLIVQEHLPAFRVPFYEQLREGLAARNVTLHLVVAPNQRNTFVKGHLDWATPVPIRWLGPIGWQPVLQRARVADFVIVQQELKYSVNPLLQFMAKCGGTPVAYWGHGRTLQSIQSAGIAETLKRYLATKAHWWFAYNDMSARIVEGLGFPAERITSVGNAVDTSRLIERKQALVAQELDKVRAELRLSSEHVAVYTGGLYPRKRIGFLIDAAVRIRQQISDFELIIIGDGPDRHLVAGAAASHPWIHDVGPRSATDKVPYWALSQVLLMPGAVGLVIVDSFALGVPLVTTDYPFHGPEISYLKDDVNGVRVRCGDSVQVYANAVADLLIEPSRLHRLSAGALASASDHTIEKMAINFTAGVAQALEASIR